MKKKNQKAKTRPDKRAEGKYSIARFEDGLTPKQRLDTAKAEAQEFENRKNRENWQTREQAEAAAQQTAETIQSDIYGTLPLDLAAKLSGKAFTPAEVRAIVRTSVDLMVRQWVKGGGVSEKAIQEK
jgi:hypothetical protein